MNRLFFAISIAIFSLAALTGIASAHAKLDHCQPAIGAASATAPTEVRCWFTEELDDKQSTLSVTDANNQRVDNGDGKVDLNDKEHKQVFTAVKSLTQGVYKVSWKVVTTDDNATTNGEWYFGVGQVTVPQAQTTPESSATTSPATTPSVAPNPTPATTSPGANTVPDTSRTFFTAGLVIAVAVGIAFIARRVIK